MSVVSSREGLLALLAEQMPLRNWPGRMPGAEKWLRGGSHAESAPAEISVIAISRAPQSGHDPLAMLRKESIPFQGIMVNTGEEEAASSADITLNLSPDTPWYTAFNLGAALASGEILIFIDAGLAPRPGFLEAWASSFREHPELLAARGNVMVPDLTGCHATGSFELAPETAFWPVDLDENMAVRSRDFYALGGFDETLSGGYGSLEFSIRLFGAHPDLRSQRHVASAILDMPRQDLFSLQNRLIQRHKSWLELNDAMKRYLELYAKFWQENSGDRPGA